MDVLKSGMGVLSVWIIACIVQMLMFYSIKSQLTMPLCPQ